MQSSFALRGPARARMIDQHAAHHLRRDANEVRPVLPRSLGLIHETKVRLVDECSGLERVVRSFAAHLSTSQSAELVVHQRNELRCGIWPAVLHVGE